MCWSGGTRSCPTRATAPVPGCSGSSRRSTSWRSTTSRTPAARGLMHGRRSPGRSSPTTRSETAAWPPGGASARITSRDRRVCVPSCARSGSTCRWRPPPKIRAMRVLFAGTPEVALPSLETLLGSRHEVVAVLTRPDAPTGRGRHFRPSPVKARAEAAGVPVLAPRTLRDPDVVASLAALYMECAAVVAYGALLPVTVLDLPRHGWVNLHFSLLPAWRGAAPVQHAILHGDEVTGATTFQITEGLDEGEVFGTLTEQIRPRDTAGDLLGRLAASGSGLLLATLDGIADGVLAAVLE